MLSIDSKATILLLPWIATLALILTPKDASAQTQVLQPEGEGVHVKVGPGFSTRFGRGLLFTKLRSGSREDRLAAARELGRQRDPNAVPGLLEIVSGENGVATGPVLEAVVDALGEIGDRRAVPLLLELLEGRRPAQRAAIRALGRIGDERALDPIANLLGNRTLSAEAIAALPHLGPRVLMRGVGLLRRPGTAGPACLLLARLGDRRATWPMVQALTAPQSQIRRQCADGLGQLGDPRAQRALQALLIDPDISVRRRAISALVTLVDGSMGPVLASLVDDPEFGSMVILALRGPTAVAAIPHLAQVAAGAPSPSRAEAIAALGRIGGADGAQSLEELLSSPDGEVRFQAATSLARIGPEHGLDVLLNAARSDGPGRVEALRGLGDLYRSVSLFDETREAPDEVRQLARAAIDEESPSVASAGVYLAGAIQDEDSLGELVARLSRPDALERAQAATALGWMSNSDACDPLREALRDPTEEVQAAAAWSIGELNCRNSASEITALLERGTDRVTGNAAWAAGEIGARRAIPTLRRRLTEGGPAVRSNAALALAALGDSSSGTMIRRRLRQERSVAVRAAMIAALGRLGDPASEELLDELSSVDGSLGQLASDAQLALEQGRRLPTPRGSEIFRTRLINDGGDPISGVWYTLSLPDYRMQVGITDQSGEIALPGLPDGPCVLGVGRTP